MQLDNPYKRSFMHDFSIHDIPHPRPLSIILFVLTIGSQVAHTLTHAEINMWIATLAGILSITHYVLTFIKIYKKKKHGK